MSFGRKTPDIPMYEEMKDTPFISNQRDLSQRGYEGYRDNYNRVNTFLPETQASLDAQVNDIYRRAEGDFGRQHRDTMQKHADANYGQFGTLNATPALYRTDMENLQQQRKLADLAYNKELYRNQVVDNELNRRYKSLDMFNQMLEKGQTPYQQDLENWSIRNQNIDRDFQNQVARYNQKGNWGRWLGSLHDPHDIFGLSEAMGPVYANQISGNTPKINWSNAMNVAMVIMGAISKNPQMMEQGTKNLANAEDQYAPDMEALYSSGSTPWSSSFNTNIAPLMSSGGSGYGSMGDFGRQDFLTGSGGFGGFGDSGGFGGFGGFSF